jgi:hypothetical protein
MKLYRLANSTVTQMVGFKGPIPLPKKPDWFQLDMAEELLRRTEGRAKVVFPEGMTRETARIESMIQKSEKLKQWDQLESKKALKAEKAGNTYEGALSKLRLRYNLPKLTAYERGILAESEHPVEQLMRGIGQMNPDEIRAMNITEVQEMIGKTKRVGDMAPVQASDLEDLGTSFRFMMDEKGLPVKPLIAYKRPFQVAEWTADHTAERLAAAKMYSIQQMTAANAAPITRAISASILTSPDFDTAARTHELLDTQVQGSLTGKAPQSAQGMTGKAFISSDWRDRDNPVLLAASRLRENINRQARDYMKAMVDSAFEGRLSLLSNPRNASSKMLLNQFHTYRAGWDIAPKPVTRSDGFYGFILRPTEENKTRFSQMFGQEMNPKGQILMAPNGKEIVLDELGMEMQTRFNKVTEGIRAEKNTLLRANGRQEISDLPWYVPPPNTDGKFIGFTFGPDNKPVPGMTVVAETEADFARGREAILSKIEGMGLGYSFRTRESIREFASIWDKVQMDFVNPGLTAVQPGKSNKGLLAGITLDTEAFEKSLRHLQSDFLAHSGDIAYTLLREQINSAKARATVSAQMTQNMADRRFKYSGSNVYSYYLENLLGKSKLNADGSWVGRIYGSIEGFLDKHLADATPGAARVWNATNEWFNRRTHLDSAQARRDFDALSTKLGKYMPFESAVRMAEAQGMSKPPITSAAFMGSVSKFTATVVLRMGEVAHGIMNLTGIVNASPAVIRNFTPRTGETVDDFARRVGHSANIFELPDGRAVASLDMVKIGQRAFKKAWSRDRHPDFDYMVRRGFLSQEVAEFHRQFGAIEAPGAWRKFFEGDPNKSSRLNFKVVKGTREPTGPIKSKGVVGWTSILSDKSEDFSRSWGHMIGLEVAETLGIKGMEAKHSFAHDVANKMIANYSPQNRPEIFQGALGAPIGLFQSFIMNYYQRLFRYAETKDYRALATQMGTQAGLFGVGSLPGYGLVNQMFGGQEEGYEPGSGIYRNFRDGGDLLAHGVLSQIPKLFGAPDGVDLYSRGDVNIRQLQFQGGETVLGAIGNQLAANTPALGVAKKAWDGIRQGIGLFSDNNPDLSLTQIGEVLSNAMANRPIAGLIEQFVAGGNDTDPLGQLVTETHGAMESAYRLLGVRSMRQARELEAFYANKNAMAHDAANKEQLNFYTRQMIRSGNTEALPQAFEQYLKNGGDPRHFRRWIKASYIAATSTRAERQLEKALNNPNQVEQVMRLLDAGVGVAEDEALGNGTDIYQANATAQPLTQGQDF